MATLEQLDQLEAQEIGVEVQRQCHVPYVHHGVIEFQIRASLCGAVFPLFGHGCYPFLISPVILQKGRNGARARGSNSRPKSRCSTGLNLEIGGSWTYDSGGVQVETKIFNLAGTHSAFPERA
jgi:hypothetical protein